MSNPYYGHGDSVPVYLSRGNSSTMEAEFDLVAAGFDAAYATIGTTLPASIALKGAIAGQTWTGTHVFPAATTGVTAAFGSSGTAYATLDFVNAVATSAALPGQILGFLRSTGTVATFGVAHTGYAQNEVKGADIASAGTINLTTATGNFVHLTGTTTVTAITIPIGAKRTVIADGALILTHSSALLLPGAANITTAANDRFDVVGDTAGAVVTSYTKADGTAVKTGIVLLAILTPTAAANIDFLTTFTSSYDNYLVIGEGITAPSFGNLLCRLATAGSADAGSSYVQADFQGAATSTTTSTSFNIATGQRDSGSGVSFVMNINNCNDATNTKSVILDSVGNGSAGSTTYTFVGYRCAYTPQNTVSGLRIYLSTGGNFAATGKVRVYGYNNS